MTIEQQIANALNGAASSADKLAQLISETEAAMAAAELAAAAARTKALDLTTDPEQVLAVQRKAELTRDRLQAALPRLQARQQQVADAEEYGRWAGSFDQLKPRHKAAADRLKAIYQKVEAELIPALAEARAMDAERLLCGTVTVRAAVDKVAESKLVETFLALALNADLNPAELAQLRNDVAKRSGLGRREITAMLKAAQQERAAKHKQEARERRARERTDPRLQVPRPADDADWLPQMHTLNGVISKSNALHPPVRDIDDVAARGRQIALPKMHAFITNDKPEGDCNDQPASS